MFVLSFLVVHLNLFRYDEMFLLFTYDIRIKIIITLFKLKKIY